MKYSLVLSLFILSFYPSAFAQTESLYAKTDFNKLYKSITDEYGFDQVLVNGFLYTDKYWKKEGHQFFLEDKLYKGSLVFKGKEYTRLEMKYDICDQLVIFYIKYNYLTVGVVPPDDFISAFSLDDKFFSKYNFQGEPKFYQVVFDTDKLKCLYHWSKQVQETSNGGNSNYYYFEFTDSERKSYLFLDGSFQLYRNNRTFTDLFPQEIRPGVRQYLKSNRIKVTKDGDVTIKELLTYCQSLF
jgi:hypothetical protein